MTEVKSFKTTDGSELVAEVISKQFGSNEEVVSYKLRRPQVLQFQPVGANQMGLAFVPWLLSNPSLDSVTVSSKILLVEFETAPEVASQYLTQMSGIKLPPAGKIIGA